MAIASVAEFKTHLGLTGTTDDAKYQAYLNQAEAIISKHTGLIFTSAAATEFYLGTGTNALILRRRPVTSISSVYVDDAGYFGFASGAFASSTLLTSGTDYALQIETSGSSITGILYRIGSVWPNVTLSSSGDLVGGPMPGIGNIKITYTAGYSTTPSDLKLAGMSMARLIMLTAAHGGRSLASESLEYYSYTLKNNDDAKSDLWAVKSILNNYRKAIW